jgi:Ca-activated chloride channel family protein
MNTSTTRDETPVARSTGCVLVTPLFLGFRCASPQALCSRLLRRLFVCVCLILPLSISRAQEPQPSPAQLPTQLVTMSLIVTDKHHHSVDEVRQEEIQLKDDKQTPAILSFSRDTRSVDYALVLDATGSFRKELAAVLEAAKSLISANHADDETFIETFVDTDNIAKLQEFTSDKIELNKALDSIFVRGGQSAIVDAVYMAIQHTAEYRKGSAQRRRALVLFTDGEDRASYYSSDKLVKLLRENDVQVFIVGLVKELDQHGSETRRSSREKAELLLHRIAEESGGRVFFPDDLKEMATAIAEIQHDLHSQYLIAFETQTKPGEKGFRKIEFKVASSDGREKLSAITRPGYSVNVQPAVPKATEKKSP